MTIAHNPILPGHHPDPSICRVGDDFYLVTSSFAYFPGIPIYHSRDLVHWQQIGNVLDRASQAPLDGLESSDGVWAPTIREHLGTFFVVCTIASGRRGWMTFVTTATDPAGPWSDIVDLDADGIDPSLFFDDDGRAWFCGARDATDGRERAELWMREFDPAALALVGQEHILWHGAMRGEWCEAPHVYKRDGAYWLLGAEGGTERNHAVVAARSSTVTGPYETDRRSPLLTHRHFGDDEPVQCVGHADLVDLDDGSSWAVMLATRPIDGTHTLGRETFGAPVEWTQLGPVFASGSGRLALEFDAPLPSAGTDPTPSRVTFEAGVPAGWVSLRAPLGDRLGTGVDGLRLRASSIGLESTGTPSFVARPQDEVEFSAETVVILEAANFEDSGALVVFQNQSRWAAIRVVRTDNGLRADVVALDDTAPEVLTSQPVPGSSAAIRVTGDRRAYRFEIGDEGAAWSLLTEIPRPWFSTEAAGGFVGVHVGLLASTPVGEGGWVGFRWFDYRSAGADHD